MLKKFLLPIVLFILSFGVSTAKTTLSVMDLSASGVSEDEAKTMTYRLIAELDKLQERSWFTLVTTEKRESVLKEWALQHTGACDQASCIAKFGKALGVRKMIGGNVGKVGQTYSVTLLLVDVATAKVEKTARREHKGEVDALLGIFSSLAGEIVGKEVKEEEMTAPVAPPPPLPAPVETVAVTLSAPTSKIKKIYGKGYQLYELKKYAEAKIEFENVLKMAPPESSYREKAEKYLKAIEEKLSRAYDEARVRYIMADMSLGGPVSYYRGYPNDANAVEAVRRWDGGVRVTNANRFERKIVGEKSWQIVYKGTNRTIDRMDVRLTTD
ncbi:MAG: hypothetical protein AB1393_00255 [Candidatus Edwardsbacteria bacterium]